VREGDTPQGHVPGTAKFDKTLVAKPGMLTSQLSEDHDHGVQTRHLAGGRPAHSVRQGRRAAEAHDAIALSVPVVKAMLAQGRAARLRGLGHGDPQPDLEQHRPRGAAGRRGDPTIPAFSTIMACSTSMIGVIEAAGMIDGRGRDLALVGGVESMSKVQVGQHRLLDWIKQVPGRQDRPARSWRHLGKLKASDLKLWIPKVANRTTGLSMGEHTEITAKEWKLSRADQDQIAFESHQHAVKGLGGRLLRRPGDPDRRRQARHHPAQGLDAGEAGQAGSGLRQDQRQGHADGRQFLAPDRRGGGDLGGVRGGHGPPAGRDAAVKIVDYEVTSIDLRHEGLLMAPAYGVPRMLARNGMTYADVGLWEIHEAFAAQVLSHIAAWEDEPSCKTKAGVGAWASSRASG
jgi:acetyl-CoA C-acetyltransferase